MSPHSAQGASRDPNWTTEPKNKPGQGTRLRVARFVVNAGGMTSGRIPQALAVRGSTGCNREGKLQRAILIHRDRAHEHVGAPPAGRGQATARHPEGALRRGRQIHT